MTRKGITLVELLIVIAVVGILATIAAGSYPRDRIAVNQAAEVFQRDLERARFNAISANALIAFSILPDGTGYSADWGGSSQGDDRWVFEVDLASSGLGSVTVAAALVDEDSTKTGPGAAVAGSWVFDTRGVAIGQGDDSGALHAVTFSAGVQQRVLVVNRYGRVQ